MSEIPENKDKARTEIEKHAHIAYRVAVDQLINEGNLFWSRFNVLIVANSVIVAAIGFTFKANQPLILLAVTLPIMGLVLCFLWFLMTKSGFNVCYNYSLQCREFEENHLAESARPITKAIRYSCGETITYSIPNAPILTKIDKLTRVLDIRRVSYLIIVVFAIVYLISLVQFLKN